MPSPTRSNSWERAGFFARNEEIYVEDEPADYLYKVVTGNVRTYKVLSDGRRQIAGFHLPGNVFGLEIGDVRSCSAEAVAAATILVIKRSALAARAARDSQLATHLGRSPRAKSNACKTTCYS